MKTPDISWFRIYRYHLLAGLYVSVTGAIIFRVMRQPYSWSMKVDQIETVFKATTLGSLILGIGISGKLNQPRSARCRTWIVVLPASLLFKQQYHLDSKR